MTPEAVALVFVAFGCGVAAALLRPQQTRYVEVPPGLRSTEPLPPPPLRGASRRSVACTAPWPVTRPTPFEAGHAAYQPAPDVGPRQDGEVEPVFYIDLSETQP